MDSTYAGRYACVARNKFSPPTDERRWTIRTITLMPPSSVRVIPARPPKLYYRQGFFLECHAGGYSIIFLVKECFSTLSNRVFFKLALILLTTYQC